MGCSSHYRHRDQSAPGDQDRLLTRIIIAMHAETGLREIGFAGLVRYMKRGAEAYGKFKSFLPATEAEVRSRIDLLERIGWISVKDNRISISFVGFLLCGPLPIPENIADSFGEEDFDAEILSRA